MKDLAGQLKLLLRILRDIYNLKTEDGFISAEKLQSVIKLIERTIKSNKKD